MPTQASLPRHPLEKLSTASSCLNVGAKPDAVHREWAGQDTSYLQWAPVQVGPAVVLPFATSMGVCGTFTGESVWNSISKQMQGASFVLLERECGAWRQLAQQAQQLNPKGSDIPRAMPKIASTFCPSLLHSCKPPQASVKYFAARAFPPPLAGARRPLQFYQQWRRQQAA